MGSFRSWEHIDFIFILVYVKVKAFQTPVCSLSTTTEEDRFSI